MKNSKTEPFNINQEVLRIMNSLPPNFKPLGILGTDQNGVLHFIPIQDSQTTTLTNQDQPLPTTPGRIVKNLSPEEYKISREKEKDLTVEGILKKHEMQQKEVS